MDELDTLSFVKGDNPLCIVHFPRVGLILYASTEAILNRALTKMRIALGKAVKVEIRCGEILKIDAQGKQSRGSFCTDHLFFHSYYPVRYEGYYPAHGPEQSYEEGYLDELKTAARYYGFDSGWVDAWYQQGLTLGEIEELFYTGEL